MEIGASSACFYPLETEKSLLHVAELGFKHCEVFFNSTSELRKPFINELCAIRDAYGMDIVSVHPYCSFSEGYNIFSCYERRYIDSKTEYKRYFEAAAMLGAKYIVMHGAKQLFDITQECYAKRYAELNEIAKTFGCYVAHENVVNCVGARPEFMLYLKEYVGDDFKMVLDIKQARRAGVKTKEFIGPIGKNIAHVHISDYSVDRDCTPPTSDGLFDFEKLFRRLHKAGYEGRYIIELYSNGYEKEKEIIKSARFLEPILQKVRTGG